MSKVKNLYMQIEGDSTGEADIEKLKTTLKDMLRTLRRRKLEKERLKRRISKFFCKLKSKIKLRGKLDKQMEKYNKRLQPILKDYNEKKRLKLLEQQRRLKYLEEIATESKSARRIYKKNLKAYRKEAKRLKVSALKANNPVKQMTMKVQRITKKHSQLEEKISELKRELHSLMQRRRTIVLKELENEIRIIRQRIGVLKRRYASNSNTVVIYQKSREPKIMDFRKERIREKAIDEITATVAAAPTKANKVKREFREKEAKLNQIKAVVEKEPLPIGDELQVKQAKPRRLLTRFQNRKTRPRRRDSPYGDYKTPTSTTTSDESEFERSASSEKREIHIKPKKIIKSSDISEKLDNEQEKSTETKAEEHKKQPSATYEEQNLKKFAVSHRYLAKEELTEEQKKKENKKVFIKEGRSTASEYAKPNFLVSKAMQSTYKMHSDVPPDMAILNEDILKLASKTEFKTMRDLLPFTSAQYDSKGYSMPADLPIELLQEYQRFLENFRKDKKTAKSSEPSILTLRKIFKTMIDGRELKLSDITEKPVTENKIDTIIEQDGYEIEQEKDETQETRGSRMRIKGLAYDDESMYDKFLAEKMKITDEITCLKKLKDKKRSLTVKRRRTAPKPLLAKKKETKELPYEIVSDLKPPQAVNVVEITSEYSSAISLKARTNKKTSSRIDAKRSATFRKAFLAGRKATKKLPQEALPVISGQITDSGTTKQKVSLVQITTQQKPTLGMLRPAPKLQKSSQKALLAERKESKELPQETLPVISEQITDSDKTKQKVSLVQITIQQEATLGMLRSASKLQKSSQKALLTERKESKELPQETLSVISEQSTDSDKTKQKVSLVQITTQQKANLSMLRAASNLQKSSQKALLTERKESKELPQETLSVLSQKSVDTTDSQPEVVLRKINLQPHSVTKAKANLDSSTTIGDNLLTKQASKEKATVRGIIDRKIGDVNKYLKDDEYPEYPKLKEKRKRRKVIGIVCSSCYKGTCSCRRRKTK